MRVGEDVGPLRGREAAEAVAVGQRRRVEEDLQLLLWPLEDRRRLSVGGVGGPPRGMLSRASMAENGVKVSVGSGPSSASAPL